MIERTVFHLRKKDLVQVMRGADKGKTGKILRVNHKNGRITVEKVALVKRHTKPTGKAPGGIVEKESSIASSNLLLYCEKCSKGTRMASKILESGRKVRVCRKCKTQADK
jgi:large subunit ribosomal protein L24